jgi:hypothetical protein
LGNVRYILSTYPDAKTELIIWESAQRPDARWQAATWWLSDANAFPAVKIDKAVGTSAKTRYADSAVGRLFLSDWQISEEGDARALFTLWQKMRARPEPFIAHSQVLSVSEKKPAAIIGGQWSNAIRWLLALLFMIERSLSHARRVR